MSYMDYPGNKGMSGFSGSMPFDAYLRKNEISNVPEDPNSFRKHIFSEMVDFRPDEPFTEAGEIRRDNHSAERISLRVSGHRSGAEAWLPDGVNLELTEKDPRGTATGPDFKKVVDQAYARAPLINFYPDADWSTTEQGINPMTMVKNIKSLYYPIKERLKIFNTSKGNFHSGTGISNSHQRENTRVTNQTMDGVIVDLASNEMKNRLDAVARLSADPRIAFWHGTPDHRFKIAKYGATNVNKWYKHTDISNNRLSTFVDHKTSIPFRGQIVAKGLAKLMANVEGNVRTRMEVAKGAQYGKQEKTRVRTTKIPEEDIFKMLKIVGTQPKSANENFTNALMIRGNNGKPTDRSINANQTFIDHDILRSMTLATRVQKERQQLDLRDKIEQMSADQGIYNEQATYSRIFKSENISREGLDMRHIDGSKHIANYAGIKPAENLHNARMLQQYAPRADGDKSKIRGGKRMSDAHVNQQERFSNEQSMGWEANPFDRAARADSMEHVGRRLQQNQDSDAYGYELTEAVGQPHQIYKNPPVFVR